MFEFRNGEQSMRFILLRVVRISHLSGEWKRHCDGTRRESDKSITIVDSRFNANSTYFISVQLLLLLLSSIRVWVSKWRTINATHFVTIRLVTSSTDQPFIGQVKKTNETRIRQKYYHRGFSFQREFYIFYICPTIIIIIIVIYSRLSFEMENNQCDSILLISTDRPFIGQVKKTMESDKSIIVVDSRFNANSTYFISVQF